MAQRSAQEILDAAASAGFPDPTTAALYAYIESGWDDAAVSPTGCCGAWQLCPCIGNGDLQANAKAAYAKFHAAGDQWTDWTPYDGGSSNPKWAQGQALLQGKSANAQPGQSGSSDWGLSSGVKSISNWMQGGGMVILGVIVLGVGAWILAGRTEAGRSFERGITRGGLFVATKGVL